VGNAKIMTRLQLNVEYHVVEFNTGVPFPNEVFTWLNDTLGDGKDGRWMLHYPNLYFKNAVDHLMFTIRWSSHEDN